MYNFVLIAHNLLRWVVLIAGVIAVIKASIWAMQVLYETDAQRREPILAVVGVLQFDVALARLDTEYGVKSRLQPLPHTLCRLLSGPQAQIDALPWGYSMIKVRDAGGNLIALMNSQHELDFYSDKYPELSFTEIS